MWVSWENREDRLTTAVSCALPFGMSVDPRGVERPVALGDHRLRGRAEQGELMSHDDSHDDSRDDVVTGTPREPGCRSGRQSPAGSAPR
jgi:hypothetical protein